MRKFTLFILALACLCTQAQTRYVGGDISMLPKYEQYNKAYKDINGKKITDLIPWFMSDCGWNTFRVRIFVHPDQKAPDYKSTDLAVCQDLEYVTALGKRIKDAGAYFLLDFHYSDSWVDASHIQAPAAWKGASDEVMADSVGRYTREVLTALNAAGATPDLVQVGNEIMYGLCDRRVHPYDYTTDKWSAYTMLLRAGCNAVRELCPNAQIIIHTDRPCDKNYNRYYYTKLINYDVDFDIIGLSYYPFWHAYMTPTETNTGAEVLQPLINAINKLATDFPTKQVQIVEFAYNFQYWPTSGVKYDTRPVWPCQDDDKGSDGIKGQFNFVKDFVDNLKPLTNLNGINYWFPEEAGTGDGANEGKIMAGYLNRGFWNPTAGSSGHSILKVGAASLGQCAPYYMRNFLNGSGTGIETLTLQSDIPTRKILKEGQLLILRSDGSLFAPDGSRR